jgi:hypothetical protein
MSQPRRRARGLTHRLLASGLVQTFGLDALLVTALFAIGASVYRLAPDLVFAYGGALLLVGWWAIGKDRAKEQPK